MGSAPKRFILKQVVAEARTEHPPIEIETDDGQVFTFDAPQFWSDTVIDPTVGPVGTAQAVMGVEQFAAFVAAGGSVAYLNLVIDAYGKDQGVTPGESSAS